MDKYRNEKLDDFMKGLEESLVNIVAKKSGSLDVMGVLNRNRRDNPELSIDEAVILAMRDEGARIMRKTIALATSLDRITVMVNQMADEMGEDGNQNGERYRNRLKVLTNFDKIVKEMMQLPEGQKNKSIIV